MDLAERIEKMERMCSEIDSKQVGNIFKRYELEGVKNSLSLEEIVGIYLMSSEWKTVVDSEIFGIKEIANMYGYSIVHKEFRVMPKRFLKMIENNKLIEDLLRGGIDRKMLQESLKVCNDVRARKIQRRSKLIEIKNVS